jgi:hypothetical protein
MAITVITCGGRREPCDTPSCGRRSEGNCQHPLPKIRRNGALVDAPAGTVCGRPVCRHCSVEVDGKILCLAHARFVGKGHGS